MPHKQRIKTISHAIGLSVNDSEPPVYFYPSNNSVTEYITYSLSDGKKFNPCVHGMWLQPRFLTAGNFTLWPEFPPDEYGTPADSVKWEFTGMNMFWYITGPGFHLKDLPASIVNIFMDQFLTEFHNLEVNAYESMIPKIPDKLSIINFLIELKDYKKMFSYWDRRKKFLKNIAGGILNFSFGWKPFLSDVCEILRALGEYKQQLKKLLAREHAYNRSRRSYNGTHQGVLPPSTASYDVPWPEVGSLHVRFDMSYEVKWSLAWTMKYTFWIPDLSRHFLQLRAFLDSFGINWNPAIIWNAIPFSFVVDWFFNVSKWLERSYASPAFEVMMRVFDYCQVVILHINVRTDVSINTNLTGEGDPEWTYVTTCVDKYVHFERTVKLPPHEVLIEKGWALNVLRKMILGASLLHANVGNPYKVTIRPRRAGAARRRR